MAGNIEELSGPVKYYSLKFMTEAEKRKKFADSKLPIFTQLDDLSAEELALIVMKNLNEEGGD